MEDLRCLHHVLRGCLADHLPVMHKMFLPHVSANYVFCTKTLPFQVSLKESRYAIGFITDRDVTAYTGFTKRATGQTKAELVLDLTGEQAGASIVGEQDSLLLANDRTESGPACKVTKVF